MKIYLSILLLCFTFLGFSQTVKVINTNTNETLEMVSISSLEPFATAQTNMQGEAEISAFLSAKKIDFRLIGFKTLVISFEQLKAQNFLVKLDENLFTTDDIIVSAVKWKQTTNEVPVKITSISAKEVALQNPQTAADMLNTSGEVFIQKSQQGGGSPMIRGFSTNRLLYTVDGVRMNTAIFRSGNLQNVISLDALAMQNTEVLFGPSSVIYGSDAIGGVMSFTTLKPAFSDTKKPLLKGNVLARYASANFEKTGHFDVAVGFKKFALLTSFTYSDFDDLRMGSHGPEEYLKKYIVERVDSQDVIKENSNPLVQNPTAYSQFNVMQKIAYKATDYLQFDYGFHYSETSSYGRYDRHIRTRNGLPRSAVWDYGPQKWMMNHLTVSIDKKNVLFDQLKINAAQQFFEESRIDRNLNKNDENTTLEKVYAYSLNIDFLKQVHKRHYLYYGLEGVNNVVHSFGSVRDIATDITTAGAARYPTAGWATLAAYANYQFKINEKWALQAGLRYSHVLINADFGNNVAFYPLPETKLKLNKGAVTGSVGANFSPTENTHLRASFATGFRAPNIDDLGKFFESTPGNVVVPNAQLKPEYAYNGELGLSQIMLKVIKLDITAYYTYLQDALVRRNSQLNGQDSLLYAGEMSQVQSIQNAANANVWGVQFGLEAKMPLGFTFYGAYNFQRGFEELDNSDISFSRHAAPMFGRVGISYRYKQLLIDLQAPFSGSKAYNELPEEEKEKAYIYAIDENGKPYSPAWATLNFKALYQIHKNLSISAGVENILDTRYKTYSSGSVAAGRNFMLSAKASF